MKTDEEGFIVPGGSLDPAVMDTLKDNARRKQTRGMSSSQRKKAARDEKRNTRHIDIPPTLEKVIEDKANQAGVSFSSMATYLLGLGLDQLDMDTVLEIRSPIRSMRWEFEIPYKSSASGSTKRNR